MPDQPYVYDEDINWGLLRLWAGRRDLDVLDVGCGYATTSQKIAQLGNRVTGIESSDEAVAKARTRVGVVVQADLQDMAAVRSSIAASRFDAIVFADVLEHLAWPGKVLSAYLEFLRPGGSVFVSLPNVGLWAVRLSVLFGSFNYADSGVLDRTHLRFFTRRSARGLIEGAGLAITNTTYNPGIVRPLVPLAKRLVRSREGEHDPSALLESRAYKGYMKSVYPIERAVARMAPGLMAFQMIFEAKRR